MTMQEDTESSEQRHEKGCTRASTQLSQLLSQRSRDTERVTCSTIAGRRAWAVRRNIQNCGGTGKLGFPIPQLLLQNIALQPIALPLRKVAILKRQRRQWRIP